MPAFLEEQLGALRLPPGSEASAGKLPAVMGLYFSAQWCAPCCAFTPVLVDRYAALKKAGKEFDFVLVSSDRTAAEFDEYHQGMPWPAIPFSDPDRKAKLAKKYGVCVCARVCVCV
jgi:nucleoredoxin